MGLKTCCFLLLLLKSLSCSDDKDASCMFSSCVNCHGHFLWGKHANIQHLQSASTFTSLLFISFDYDIDCQRLEIREANLTFLYSGTTRILIHNLYLSCFYLECWLTQTSALFLGCSEYKLYRGASNIELFFSLVFHLWSHSYRYTQKSGDVQSYTAQSTTWWTVGLTSGSIQYVTSGFVEHYFPV